MIKAESYFVPFVLFNINALTWNNSYLAKILGIPIFFCTGNVRGYYGVCVTFYEFLYGTESSAQQFFAANADNWHTKLNVLPIIYIRS